MRQWLVPLLIFLPAALWAQADCSWWMGVPLEPMDQPSIEFSFSEAEKAALGGVSRVDSVWVMWDDDYGFWEYETIFEYGTHRVDSARCVRDFGQVQCLGLDPFLLPPPHAVFLQGGWELKGKLKVLLVELRGEHLGMPGAEKRLVLVGKKGEFLGQRPVAHFLAESVFKPKAGILLTRFREGSGQLASTGRLTVTEKGAGSEIWELGPKGILPASDK